MTSTGTPAAAPESPESGPPGSATSATSSASAAGPAGSTRPRRGLVATWGPWLAMALVLVVALAVGVNQSHEAPTNAERLNAIGKTVKCLQCSGETVADSNAAFSQEVRLDIAKRIQAGQTDDQIRTALADSYGERILLTPAATGVTSIVWILPVVVLVVGIAGMVAAFRRWRLRSDVHATAADRELVGRALSGASGPATGSVPDDPEMGAGR